MGHFGPSSLDCTHTVYAATVLRNESLDAFAALDLRPGWGQKLNAR